MAAFNVTIKKILDLLMYVTTTESEVLWWPLHVPAWKYVMAMFQEVYLGKTQMLKANHPEHYRRFMISTIVNPCSATLSQVSRRNMLSSAAVNSLGDMVSPCRTLLLVLILLLSSCRLTVIELLV